MDQQIQRHLVDLNARFYRQFAESFAETRSEPQPGFSQLASYLPPSCMGMLDVGCGEGRLGRFMLGRDLIEAYDGVDASQELLNIASKQISGRFWQRDLMLAGALDGLGQYECIACLAVLQHIPGRANRVRLLNEMGAHLKHGGRLLLSTWQFLSSERQRHKIVDWSAAGLSPDDLEANDYLLTWQRGGLGHRYVNYIDEQEMQSMLGEAGLRPLASFRADGREGDLNLYTIGMVDAPTANRSTRSAG